MRNVTTTVFAVSVLMLGARTTSAQETPTFHRGQWAAEFSGGAGLSAGLLRFYSPTSALAISFGGNISRQYSESNTGPDLENSHGYLSVAIGVRRHTSVAPRVVAWNELGVVGTVLHDRSEYNDLSGTAVESRRSGFSGSGYGEIGGQYFVTSHIALGAAATLYAGGNWSSDRTGTSRGRSHGFALSTGLTPIMFTLYF